MGDKVRLRAFNGQIPGPILYTAPGERLSVTVQNDLPLYDSGAWTGDHNVPHMLDATNLHLHGLEIKPHLFTPLGTSDPLAPMVAIRPRGALTYIFDLPDDHPSGLFWYHPHHHGSTVVQAVTGMAGAVVVRGPIDEVPEIKAAREEFLVVQDIGLFRSETLPDTYEYLPQQNSVWNTFTSKIQIWDSQARKMVDAPNLKGGFTTGDYSLRYFLVNGKPVFKEVHNPDNPPAPVGTQLPVNKIKMRPGQVVRFRMLNANSDDLMPVAVEGHDMVLIALDGVNFTQPRTIPAPPATGASTGQVQLAPANRAEFLLKGASRPGIYRILQLRQSAQFLQSEPRVLAEIEITGTPMDMALPDSLPTPSRHYPLIKPEEVTRRRQVIFSGTAPDGTYMNEIIGLDFMLNGQLYDERAIAATVNVGEVEEWKLVVPDSNHGGTEGHPFHIHVNSFEVISVNGKPQPMGTIQDTVWVAKNSEVIIRMRFREWQGKAVYHCHILPHEDTGMMQNFLIAEPDGRH